MSSKRFAALDLGSLTARLAVAERAGPGRFRVLKHCREVTGLGEGLAQTGSLASEAMDRTLAAAGRFLREAADLGVGELEAVATQAVRQARNRDDFLMRLQEELGLRVRVLAPEEEARLALTGVLTALAPEYLKEPALAVFDVGGGSSEFALVRQGREPEFASLPLGVLTLSQARPLGDPPGPQQVTALKQELAGRLQEFYQALVEPRVQVPPRLVGTAGAVTTLAAMALKMAEYDPDRVNNFILTRAQVETLAERICRLPGEERARLPGMEPAKAGVMPAGVLLILAILAAFRQESLVVVDAGLLEGVLHEMSSKFWVSS
jgi:exopolyphosphatase/guanosine-5'-triphosphate,3'-diphosphate pyrophosphatase